MSEHVRIFPQQSRAYIDMDGVIADYVGGAEKHNIHLDLFQRVAGSYLNLDVIAGSHDAFHALEKMGFFLFILTRLPSDNPYAALEKIQWLQRHFPGMKDHIVMTPDKGALGKPGDILIDDHPEWANSENFGGKVFRFHGDWAASVQEVKAWQDASAEPVERLGLTL